MEVASRTRLKLQNRATSRLERFQAVIQQTPLIVQLGNPALQLSHLSRKSRVVLEHVANRAQVITTRGVQLRSRNRKSGMSRRGIA